MRVHGVEGLRVVDASAMPYVTNGNIYAPVMMLAEKASDLIAGNTPLEPERLEFYRHLADHTARRTPASTEAEEQQTAHHQDDPHDLVRDEPLLEDDHRQRDRDQREHGARGRHDRVQAPFRPIGRHHAQDVGGAGEERDQGPDPGRTRASSFRNTTTTTGRKNATCAMREPQSPATHPTRSEIQLSRNPAIPNPIAAAIAHGGRRDGSRSSRNFRRSVETSTTPATAIARPISAGPEDDAQDHDREAHTTA